MWQNEAIRAAVECSVVARLARLRRELLRRLWRLKTGHGEAAIHDSEAEGGRPPRPEKGPRQQMLPGAFLCVQPAGEGR